jgi:hypothetical protein
LKKSGAQNDETICLPFEGVDPPANEENFVKNDPDLAHLILETWQFNEAIINLQSERDDVLNNMRLNYALDSWGSDIADTMLPSRTIAETVFPQLQLFSKRKAIRSNIGHMALWGANEVFKAKMTGG